MTPAEGDGTPTVVLSVSISITTSSTATESPTFFVNLQVVRARVQIITSNELIKQHYDDDDGDQVVTLSMVKIKTEKIQKKNNTIQHITQIVVFFVDFFFIFKLSPTATHCSISK